MIRDWREVFGFDNSIEFDWLTHLEFSLRTTFNIYVFWRLVTTCPWRIWGISYGEAANEKTRRAKLVFLYRIRLLLARFHAFLVHYRRILELFILILLKIIQSETRRKQLDTHIERSDTFGCNNKKTVIPFCIFSFFE